jgi:hypothetical protein
MNHLGDLLIAIDAANPDASPIRNAYARFWEAPRPERPLFAAVAARLIRLADRLAPTAASHGMQNDVNERRLAADAIGQP